ncbi:MAG: hypothetical protein RLZZ15_1740 [Verrucomicrobiota bacterium]|jgi:tetratricopeptide (TPR) repeat protein
MKLRCQFVWKKANFADDRFPRLRGLARLVECETPAGHVRLLWLDARKLILWPSLAAVALWFATAAGLHHWLQRDPNNRVAYADLIAPWRWSRLADLRGQSHIQTGLDQLRARRYGQGVFLVRQGLALHPDDARARLVVARLFVRSDYYGGVRGVLLPQLAFATTPPEFTRFLIAEARRNDDWETVLAASERALAAGSPADGGEPAWLRAQTIDALLALENFPAALAALDAAAPPAAPSLAARAQRVAALLGLGRAADALAAIRAWGAAVPAEFRLEHLATALHAERRFDEMETTLDALCRECPTDPAPRLQAIAQCARAGRPAAAARHLEACLRRFNADVPAMDRLQKTLVETGVPTLMERFVADAQQFGRPLVIPRFNLVLACLTAGDLASAHRAFDALLAEDEHLRARTATALPPTAATPLLLPAQRDWLRSLLAAAASPEAKRTEALCAVLVRERFPRLLFIRTVHLLAHADRWSAVAAVSATGLARFPESTALKHWHATARRNTSPPSPRSPLPPTPPRTEVSPFRRSAFLPFSSHAAQPRRPRLPGGEKHPRVPPPPAADPRGGD